MNSSPRPIAFCSDDELGYLRDRTPMPAGTGLKLDSAYRLAHLPLIAPEHPRVVRSRAGTPYAMGRHAHVFSLVLPVPGDLLERSAPYQKLLGELRSSSFGQKVAWDLLERRRAKLHATICGSLATETPPVIGKTCRRELAGLGRISVELRGLFSGNVNVGRLYLKAYPESRDGVNTFGLIQRVMGCRETDLYVVGIFNLIDDLDPAEAAALATLVERWWDRPILRFTADRLWLLGASDDLVLDSAVEEEIPLVADFSS